MWVMDYRQAVSWLVPILARGVAWVLAVRLGMEAAQAQDVATQAASAIGALVLVGVSIYTSVKGRQKLLNTEPPLFRK